MNIIANYSVVVLRESGGWWAGSWVCSEGYASLTGSGALLPITGQLFVVPKVEYREFWMIHWVIFSVLVNTD